MKKTLVVFGKIIGMIFKVIFEIMRITGKVLFAIGAAMVFRRD